MTAKGSGTKDDPWQLKTPPGTSDYQMWRDEAADPPALVCQVGSTKLQVPPERDRRPPRDAQGARRLDGPRRGRRAEGRQARHGRGVGSRPRTTRSVAGTACGRAIAGGSGCTCRRCSRRSGKAELTHDAKNNRMRAI